MGTFFVSLIMLLVWLVSLLAGSGVGQAYGLYTKAETVVIVVFGLIMVQKIIIHGLVNVKRLLLFVLIGSIFVIWPMIQGNGLIGLNYAWLLLIPYVFSHFSVSTRQLQAVSVMYGVLALAILAAHEYFDFFSGWNPNDIAMIACFSCAVLCIAPWKSALHRILVGLGLIISTYLIFLSNSRCSLFAMLLLIWSFFSMGLAAKFVQSRRVRWIVLLIPLIAASFVVFFENTPIFEKLNKWSVNTFSKELFNGRDAAWADGFQSFIQHPLLGVGEINNGYWHNCAISCVYSFGAVGYLIWLMYFDNIFSDATDYMYDPCVQGCITSFLIIMIQQTAELGLISTTGSLIPYAILGLLLARVRHLREAAA